MRDVLNTVQKVIDGPIKIVEEPRRAGDPPELIANVDKIHKTLEWTPRYDDLEVIVSTAIDWERKLQQRAA